MVGQGVPIYKDLAEACGCPYPLFGNLDRLSSANIKLLAGNSMHVAVVGHIWMFALAFARKNWEVELSGFEVEG